MPVADREVFRGTIWRGRTGAYNGNLRAEPVVGPSACMQTPWSGGQGAKLREVEKLLSLAWAKIREWTAGHFALTFDVEATPYVLPPHFFGGRHFY